MMTGLQSVLAAPLEREVLSEQVVLSAPLAGYGYW